MVDTVSWEIPWENQIGYTFYDKCESNPYFRDKLNYLFVITKGDLIPKKSEIEGFANVISSRLKSELGINIGFTASSREVPQNIDIDYGVVVRNSSKNNHNLNAITLFLKSSTSFNSTNTKDRLNFITPHEIIHLLFDAYQEPLHQEYLADAGAVKLFGKNNAIGFLEEIRKINGEEFFHKDFGTHPSAKDRLEAIIEDRYENAIDNVFDLARQRIQSGKKTWMNLLKDRPPSSFFDRDI